MGYLFLSWQYINFKIYKTSEIYNPCYICSNRRSLDSWTPEKWLHAQTVGRNEVGVVSVDKWLIVIVWFLRVISGVLVLLGTTTPVQLFWGFIYRPASSEVFVSYHSAELFPERPMFDQFLCSIYRQMRGPADVTFNDSMYASIIC